MNFVEDVFNKNFYIEKLKYEYNSPRPDIIVRINGHQYEISFYALSTFFRKFDINLESQIMRGNYRKEYVDNRPIWKKDLDLRMGKNVDFSTKHYTTISINFLEVHLKEILKEA